MRVPVLTIVCEPCGRRERYDVERLMRHNGRTAKLTDLLPALVADCPKKWPTSSATQDSRRQMRIAPCRGCGGSGAT
jgi:hypothetical protein